MQHQVLARKWRPREFKTMVGQQHVLLALQNALDQNRLHHAYLFTGTRGVGKTTVARIFAKALNCERGISSSPCGVCDTCQAIDAGHLVDFIEVDAASKTKVEDTRDLLDNVQYAPADARFKIYLIDEVHMLSSHSFNALLKTLEEPPPHVKFLLATTDPQKLPVTVLSRCLQFHLKPLPLDLIQAHLAHVLTEEHFAFDEAALMMIAKVADGSMRDALSILDQAIAHCDGKLSEKEISEFLGTINQSSLVALMEHLAEKNTAALMQDVKNLAEADIDFSEVLNRLLGAFHQVALAQALPQMPEFGELSREAAKMLSARFSPEDLQLYYQIGLIARRDLPLAPSVKMGFEMMLLRMMAFHFGVSKSEQVTFSAPIQTAVKESPTKMAESPSKPVFLEKPIQPKEALPFNDWNELIERLALTGTTKLLASHCTLHEVLDQEWHLILSPQYSALLNDRIQERLVSALKGYLQKPIKLKIKLGQPVTKTPAEHQQEEADTKQAELMQTLGQDQGLQSLLQTFDVRLTPDMVDKK